MPEGRWMFTDPWIPNILEYQKDPVGWTAQVKAAIARDPSRQTWSKQLRFMNVIRTWSPATTQKYLASGRMQYIGAGGKEIATTTIPPWGPPQYSPTQFRAPRPVRVRELPAKTAPKARAAVETTSQPEGEEIKMNGEYFGPPAPIYEEGPTWEDVWTEAGGALPVTPMLIPEQAESSRAAVLSIATKERGEAMVNGISTRATGRGIWGEPPVSIPGAPPDLSGSVADILSGLATWGIGRLTGQVGTQPSSGRQTVPEVQSDLPEVRGYPSYPSIPPTEAALPALAGPIAAGIGRALPAIIRLMGMGLAFKEAYDIVVNVLGIGRARTPAGGYCYITDEEGNPIQKVARKSLMCCGRKRRRRGITASELSGARKVARLVKTYGYKPKVGKSR